MILFEKIQMVISALFQKPATRLYPLETREPFAATRGHVEIDQPSCIYCGLCARKCPTKAIVVNREQKEWKLQALQCIVCGCCCDVCPKKCLHMRTQYSPAQTEKKA